MSVILGNRYLFVGLGLGLFLSLLLGLPFGAVNTAAAQDAHAVRRTLQIPLEGWLSQGERADFPLKVRISKPTLTYQQRMLVKVIAEVSTDILQKRSVTRNLHFIVKVADDNGKWQKGESYVPFPVQEKMSNISELQMVDELYLQPGTFKIAVIAYDSVLQERNVSFSSIQVEKPDGQFPNLLNNMPTVEFLSGEAAGHGSFGDGRVLLPIATKRSVQLDLLVDLSSYEKDPAMKPMLPPPDRNRRIPGYNPAVLRPAKPEKEQNYLDQLLQTASVLGEMTFSNGCTQVTALDTLKRRTVLKTTPGDKVEWRNTRAEVINDSHAMISVADIQGGHQAPSFFEEQLEQVMSDNPRCGVDPKSTVHLIAVLTRGVHFAEGSPRPKVQPKCNCKVFYLRQLDNGEIDTDELKGMLSQLSPKVMEYKNPEQFRKKLSELVETVQRTAN